MTGIEHSQAQGDAVGWSDMPTSGTEHPERLGRIWRWNRAPSKLSDPAVIPAHKTANAHKASKDALRAIYYVVFGLALKEALGHAFVKDGRFVGSGMFDSAQWPTTLLFLAFLPTAIRFVHGASIHFEAFSSERYKPIFDFTGFLIQASFLYLMAITLAAPRDFAWLFIVMLLIDTAWLLVLHLSEFHQAQKTEWQWIVSNIAVVCIVTGLLRFEASLEDAWVITATSIAATLFDYYFNREFYFPKEKPNDHPMEARDP